MNDKFRLDNILRHIFNDIINEQLQPEYVMHTDHFFVTCRISILERANLSSSSLVSCEWPLSCM